MLFRSAALATETANPWGLRLMHGGVWEWCRDGGLRGGSWNAPVARRQAGSRAKADDPLHPSTVGLRVCCLPFGTPYFQLEASKSQWRPPITRAACQQVLARPLSEREFTQLEQALQQSRILGILQLRFFLALLADRIGAGADDPQHPLTHEPDPDGVTRLDLVNINDSFAMASFAWQKRGWAKLATQAKTPQLFMAELGLRGAERQQAFLQAVDRARIAFREPS